MQDSTVVDNFLADKLVYLFVATTKCVPEYTKAFYSHIRM